MFFDGIVSAIKELLLFISYVANGSSFPKPMSPEEESEYLEKYFRGDEKAKCVLIERNMRLVAHVVKKYSAPGTDAEDLISIGTIGLIKAVNTYNRHKGTQLATYAIRCIENEILMAMRSGKKQKGEILLNDPIGVDGEGNQISLMDILGTEPDTVLDEVELKLQLAKLYEKMRSSLTKRERFVLELRYGLLCGTCLPQREIAKLLGISRSYVSRIEKKALSKMSIEML
jgi:RNA polymerase sporulation-specific sigma factor